MISENYKHRDVSWLDFNFRVLQEAKDKNVPLLERIKFLAIYSSNLDEFFRVRVANHRQFVRVGRRTQRDIGYDPVKTLNHILAIVNKQQLEFSRLFDEEILPELKRNKIFILRREQLNKEQIKFIENYFKDFMLPYAQPVLLVGNKIKPFLTNNALYLALNLSERDTKKTSYAIVKVPSDHLPRFVDLPSSTQDRHNIIMIGDIVRHNISLIFPGYDIINSFSIKLTRDAELYIEDEFSGNLVDKIKKSLNRRNIGPASRLVYDRSMPKPMLDFLMNVFELTPYDLLPEGRYHNNSDFFKFPHYGLSHLKDVPLPPLSIPELEHSDNILDEINKEDFYIHVPYHKYESVVKFFEDAADDPNVTHIKIIQYRVAKVSRIMEALKRAVVNGKQVTTFIEVKARFDEETNLNWGEHLGAAGVTVYYSLPGYKVHSKMAIIRRIEDGKPKIYGYFSTGNFHENTAKLYSDVGIFTADPRITGEATRLFTFLETKKRPDKEFVHLGVGLFNLKEKFKALVQREIDNAKKGKKARMTLKMNNLEEKEMIDLLYEASKAGVEIILIVRSVCSIITGKKGLSENIHAISIVDRFLEHSRIFYFYNNDNEEIYLSSADWMERNLHYRVETLVPIYDKLNKEVFKTILSIQIHDNVKARSLDHDKVNTYIDTNYDLAVRSQTETYYYIKRMTEQRQKMRTQLMAEKNLHEVNFLNKKHLSKKVTDVDLPPKQIKITGKSVAKKIPAKKTSPPKKAAVKKVVSKKTTVKKTAVKKIVAKKITNKK